MLALSRVKDEGFLVGPDIEITVLETSIGIEERGRVKLRIKSPVAPHSSCGTRVREGDDWIVEHISFDRFYIGTHGFQVARAGDVSMKMRFIVPNGVTVSRTENRWLHLKILAGTATDDDLQSVKGAGKRAA